MKKIIFAFIITFTLSGTSILNAQVLHDPVMEVVAQGFNFVEGPVWKDGVGLLFSDIPENKIYVWNEQSGSSVYHTPTGKSNGLALDADGNLIMCQHFDRQLGKYVEGVGITSIATHYEGDRLNSPNDLAIKSDGAIFFTDPPFGLDDEHETAELSFSGIFRLSPDGDLQVLDTTLNYPNGIAFSLDESKLYVTESDVADVYVWDVIGDTAITNKTLFYDIPGSWADGMKIDEQGYLYVTGPVGVWIFAPDGTLIQTIPVLTGNSASNCNWGPEVDPTLYVTSNSTVYKITNKSIDTILVTGLTLEPDILEMNPGDTEQLTITITPSNATDQELTWDFGDGSIVSVSTTGEITAIGEGTISITATSADGPSGNCIVTVSTLSNIQNSSIEAGMELFTARPNPFNDITTIPFYLENTSELRLSVVDINGREIFILADGKYLAGTHSVDWNTSELTSGIYYIILKSESNTIIKKCIKQGNKKG